MAQQAFIVVREVYNEDEDGGRSLIPDYELIRTFVHTDAQRGEQEAQDHARIQTMLHGVPGWVEYRVHTTEIN